MNLKSAILDLVLIGVASMGSATGLQCYVCDNCNEYEDFKELHICGEVPGEMTVTPLFTRMPITSSDMITTRKTFTRTSMASSSKPIERTTTTADYLYEDSEERHESSLNSNQKNITQTSTVVGLTTTIAKDNLSTQRPTTLTEPLTKATTLPSTAVGGTAVTKESYATRKPATSAGTVTVTVTVTGTRIPIKPVPDYDDYLEYEDLLMRRRSEGKSLLKISEPVCYMIRYRANNTIVTNRGCSNFVNANKYSTCQSLSHGASMESCRICFSNGCNKFLDDNGYEDSHDILFNDAAGVHHCGILISLLAFMFIQAFI